MFIPKLFTSLLLLRLGVPVVYLIMKFSPLVIQCIIKIVTQEEEGFYLLFLIIDNRVNERDWKLPRGRSNNAI